MQEMGETREPMALDCWTAANDLANKYSKELKRDFWILYAAKPHVVHKHAIVAGWNVITQKPPTAMVGILVFHWSHENKQLTVDTELSLPPDVPLSEAELSKKVVDFTPSLADAAKRSKSIILA